MSCIEEPLVFACQGEPMLGILGLPAADPAPRSALLIIVGGPQYRVGSHRQFVQLARAAAGAGCASLRFDLRGMGDSGGTFPGFEQLDADIGAAIDALYRRLPSLRQVGLWGLCDGASAALLYWGRTRDPRVSALGVANPWARSGASLAKTHVKHYYHRRLLQREFWAKLLRGGVGLGAIGGLLRNVAAARRPAAAAGQVPFLDGMAAAWNAFPGTMLLSLSGNDYTAKEFLEHAQSNPLWAGSLRRANLLRDDVAHADHTFSGADAMAALERAVLEWMKPWLAAANT